MAKTMEEIKAIIESSNQAPATLFNNKRIDMNNKEAAINYLREGDKIEALHAARASHAASGRFLLAVEQLQ